MIAGQRLIANDGYEVMLFPLPYLYMTQDEGGNYSHLYTKNIDLVGWNGSSQVANAPIYAPCSCRCVAIWDPNSNNRVFTSLDLVHTPTGLKRVTFAFAHDNNPIASIGSTFTQGDLIAHTGTTGHVTGDHTHFNTANGTYVGYTSHHVSGSDYNYDLTNSESVWNICYVNNTIIVRGYGHNWVEYNGGVTPIPTYERRKFPFYIIARKRKSGLL